MDRGQLDNTIANASPGWQGAQGGHFNWECLSGPFIYVGLTPYTPDYHQHGLSGKDIYEFAKVNSHSNISVIVRNLHYNLQNSATGVNKVTRT